MVQSGVKSVFKKDYCEISYDSINKWVVVDWIGFITLDMIKTGTEAICSTLRDEKCSKVLNLNIRLKGTFSSASDWIANNAFPKFLSSGLKHFAWVLSPDEITKMSAQKSLAKGEKLNDFVTIFTKIEDATTWLKKQSI